MFPNFPDGKSIPEISDEIKNQFIPKRQDEPEPEPEE